MMKFHQLFRLLKKKDWKLPAETEKSNPFFAFKIPDYLVFPKGNVNPNHGIAINLSKSAETGIKSP